MPCNTCRICRIQRFTWKGANWLPKHSWSQILILFIACTICTVLPQDIQFSEDGSPITVDPTTSSEERHVAIILSKRVTWNSKFYQVTTMCIVHFRYISLHNIHILSTKVVWLERPLTKNTWEPETSLPQELVADYEAGFLQEVQRETFTTGGQTIRTLSTAPTKEVCKESRAKCPKIDSPDTLCDSSG